MVQNGGAFNAPDDLRVRCPGCRHLVTLYPTQDDDLRLLSGDGATTALVGMRICPNPDCKQFLFVEYMDGKVAFTYPPETIDFDATGIPNRVLATLEEAIACHSTECYIAAGIMVRKTLEELCEDRQAKGSNLRARIASLESIALMPRELFVGLDDLRLLGNDAAHVEARSYYQVGKEEVEISLEFTKEVLKAVYQYKDLLNRLRDLKKPRQ